MKRLIISSLLSCLAALLAQAGTPVPEVSAPPETNLSAPVDSGVFEPPRARRPSIYYPMSAIQNGEEGWVQVEFMVDTHGKTFESTVADSSGNHVLEQVALKEAKDLDFQPATENGLPVESSSSMKFVFQITGQTGARSSYITTYKEFMNAIKASDQSGARQLLAKLTPANLYEDAFYGLAQYEFALSWGTDGDQIRGLRRAIARETRARYLSKEVFDTAMQSLLPLDVKVGDYTQAVADWNYLSRNSSDQKVLDTWRPFIERIKAVQASSTPLRVHGTLDGGDWHFTPFKQTLQFEVTSGHLAVLKLRCGTHFEAFDVVPDAKYRIEPSFGKCSVETLGDPGTTFDLIES